MNISFTVPLQRAWDRMMRMLFRPFALQNWLVVGFAAFLSEYLSHALGGRYSWRERHDETTQHAVHRIAEFFHHPIWGPTIIAIVVCVALLSILLLWLTSRGRFVFLDNVVHERGAIVEPWRRFRRQGNSLFGFCLLAYIVFIAVMVMVALPLIPAILAVIQGGEWRVLGVAAIGMSGAMLSLVWLVMSYIFLFLFQFVVPIMFRDGLGVLAGWGRFLALFRQHPLAFIAYGIVYLVLSVAVFVVVGFAGVATCCVGFLLLALPYVGSVILLPVEIVMRGYGPEFLAQFGPEYSVFAPASPPPPEAR
jgi:hypothetical protein